MLIQFVIKNCLSFKDETVFRMTPTSDSRHSDHVFHSKGQKLSLLRTAAIYGANGAGKTNLVIALGFLRWLLISGVKPNAKIPLRRFKLANTNSEPAKFEIEFLKNNVHYSYGISLDDTRVHEEWLFSTRPDGGREARLFERVTSKNGITSVEFGPQLKESGEDFLSFVAQGTRAEQPFLSEAETRNVKQIQPVMDWLRSCLTIVRVSSTSRSLPIRLSKDKNFADLLGKFLKAAGTGIDAVETNEEDLNFEVHFPWMPQTTRDEILAGLDGKASFVIGIESNIDDISVVTGTKESPKILKMQTTHVTEDGSKVRFKFTEESSGTRRLIHLFPALFAMTQEEKVFVIDELDRSLHPLLSRTFLETFFKQGKRSQLIFTTHEECLLDLDLLRRDEIWFIEKDGDQASHCYPLTDYKIRPDLEIRKGYLNGRFGGIPFFGDTNSLGWGI